MTSASLSIMAFLLASISGANVEASEDVATRWVFKQPADATGWQAAHDLRDLAVTDGALRMIMTGPDAYFISPPVDVPLDGCIVRVRLRSDRDGDTQVFWATADQPDFTEQQVLTRLTPRPWIDPADPSKRGFATVEFPIGKVADQGRRLTRIRIDPYNNNADGTVEIDSVELLRPPPILDISFAPAAPWVDVGAKVPLAVTLRQTGGRASGAGCMITLPGNQAHQASPGARPATVRAEVSFDRPGVHHPRATITGPAGGAASDLQASVIVGQGDRLPIAASLRSERIRLDLIPTKDGSKIGAARWMALATDGEWKLAGWLVPLAEIVQKLEDGRIVRHQPGLAVTRQSNVSITLSGRTDGPHPSMEVTVTFELGGSKAPGQINVSAALRAPEGTRLLAFSGPVLRVDRERVTNPLDRFAVFGGLEFLEPGWPSSADRAVGERFAERWAPHPYKVTLPVMAVEAAGLTSALLWDPLQKWDGVEAMPTATFASPDFIEGQANHLMRLSVPSIPHWTQENESWARTPYVTAKDRPLGLRYVLSVEAATPAAGMARRWYETFGAPPPPARPHGDRETYDLIARNFGETMWWPEDRGWRHHWYVGTRSEPAPDMAAELIAHAAVTGETKWTEQTGLRGKMLIDAAGTLLARVGHEAHARAQMAAMRPDGTWPFTNAPSLRDQVRQLTAGRYDSLGEDGSTSLGTCVQAALPILRYAELSGDAGCTEAGVKALQAIRRFRVPRGAQVWEVHQEIPDIRAAALAVEACQIGYRLTGRREWLDEANYWAWAGVPFVYSWRVPIDRVEGRMMATRDRNDLRRMTMPLSEGFENHRREVMPYGTVPVLGPTFYVVNWFGVIVQWCGLEWAQHVIELDADRPDPLLRAIADGVVLSGLQQMFDRPPWTGLYPDVWDTQQNIAYGALIYAGLPLRCLKAQGRVPAWTQTWTRVLRSPDGGPAWHVSGWGSPPDLPLPGPAEWSVTVSGLPGQANELLLAGPEKPRRVRVGGEGVEPVAPDAPAEAIGWRYLEPRRVLALRFQQPASQARIEIAW